MEHSDIKGNQENSVNNGERHQEDEKQLTMEICEQLNNIINASPESNVSTVAGIKRGGGYDTRYNKETGYDKVKPSVVDNR